MKERKNMFAYYGYTISPNQLETVEGFLICRNVPIARTGDMEYLESELQSDGSSSKIVAVSRSPNEVFSEEALSSFEGKPVTDEHPPELITPETYSFYAKGHAQNVRKGEKEWEGCMIADLHIQDESLIKEIQDGKREISCGYDCEFRENEDGTYSQHEIRGNHIAVVNRGRAGKHVAILDSKMQKEAALQPERKKMSKKSLFFKMFAKATKDATPEEIEVLACDAAEALAEELPTKEDVKDQKEEGKKEPKKEDTIDSASIDRKLNAILDSINKKSGKVVEEEDSMDALIKELSEEEDKTEVSGAAKVIQAGAKDSATGTIDREIMVGIIKKLRPAITSISDMRERKKVSDSLLECLTDKQSVSDITKIINATQKNAQNATDHVGFVDLNDCQKAYDSMNPHKNGGEK